MKISDIHSAFFVGIGGIGMSALARYFAALGCKVGGYDRVSTALTDRLVEEGMEIGFVDDQSSIPSWFLNTPLKNALVVYTPAIPRSHLGLSFLQGHGCAVLKRSEVLNAITEGMFTIAIAGTHGKTTTTAMVAHLFKHGGMACNAFLGGISTNYNTNLILDTSSQNVVVEADEFDRSFLRLTPDVAVITSTDADHLDIYGDKEALDKSFQDFAGKVDKDGLTIIRHGVAIRPNGKSLTYAIDNPEADLAARNIRVERGAYCFEVAFGGQILGMARMTFPGRHNVENALAAIAVMLEMKMPWEVIRDGLATFKGVKRRFEYHIRRDERVYIDDYAHHPAEIRACVGSVRELYPGKRITGVFQPHLYSRTRDFVDDFAESLTALNELLLMDIYPAREEPIPGVDGQWLLNKVQMVNKKLVDRQELVAEVLRLQPEVLLTMGAGDIDKLIEPLKNALDEEDA